MKLQILSDLHLEFSLMDVPQTDADVVLLAGDINQRFKAIDWAKGFEKPVCYVLGNHEFYGQDFSEMRFSGIGRVETSEGSPVCVLQNSTVVIDGVLFIGSTLWTDMGLYDDIASASRIADLGMSDYHHIRNGERFLRAYDTIKEHYESVEFLASTLNEVKGFQGKVVVVTHHAPAIDSISHKYLGHALNPAFASNLTRILRKPVDLWVHGHVHNSCDYTVNGTRVLCNPRGYCQYGNENPHFNPYLVVEI